MGWEVLVTALMIYFALGVASGLMSGLLGIGGGLVTVPGLMFVFQHEVINPAVAMHLAVGTSLATMVPITFRSLRSHMSYDYGFLAIYKKMVPAVIVGILVGGTLARYFDSKIMTVIFGLFAFFMAITLFFQSNVVDQKKLPGRLGLLAAGGFIGVQSGLLGVGGGSFTVPFLTNRGVDIRVALVVSVSIAMTVAILGSMAYMIIGHGVPGLPEWSTGYVYWPAFTGLILGGVLMAPQGVRLSRRIPAKTLRLCFVIFLLLVSARMLFY
jgi:uncharacterized membrane protein YfcA